MAAKGRRPHAEEPESAEKPGARAVSLLAKCILQISSSASVLSLKLFMRVLWLCWSLLLHRLFSSPALRKFSLQRFLLLRSRPLGSRVLRWCVGSAVVAHRLSCSAACGISRCLLHWHLRIRKIMKQSTGLSDR